MGFSSASLFPAGKREPVSQGGTGRVIDHLMRIITQGTGIFKDKEDKQDYEGIPDKFRYNKNDTIANPHDLPRIETRLPPPHIYIYIYNVMFGSLFFINFNMRKYWIIEYLN